MFTAKVGCGEFEIFPEEIGQEFTHLDCSFYVLTVDSQADRPVISQL
jgi:hypothetical protein